MIFVKNLKRFYKNFEYTFTRSIEEVLSESLRNYKNFNLNILNLCKFFK